MKLAAICDKDTAIGLRLAGIKETHVNEENPNKIWNEISQREDVGIIFITEKVARDLGRNLKEFRIRNNIPIILEIPDKKGRSKEHIDYVSSLIKKAVGIDVGKQK